MSDLLVLCYSELTVSVRACLLVLPLGRASQPRCRHSQACRYTSMTVRRSILKCVRFVNTSSLCNRCFRPVYGSRTTFLLFFEWFLNASLANTILCCCCCCCFFLLPRVCVLSSSFRSLHRWFFQLFRASDVMMCVCVNRARHEALVQRHRR